MSRQGQGKSKGYGDEPSPAEPEEVEKEEERDQEVMDECMGQWGLGVFFLTPPDLFSTAMSPFQCACWLFLVAFLG